MAELQIVGKSVRRIDGYEKVSGTIRYGVDLSEQGMLWGRTLRSPHPYARVISIDTSRAEALAGVATVVTAADIKGTNRHGIERRDQPVLVAVGEYVRMLGDPVAAVAARTKEIADEALALIDVEYEPLPGIYSMHAAIAEGAAQLYADTPNNVITDYSDSRGDVDQAFAEADAIVEGEFILPRQEQAYLEVEGGLAKVDAQGVVTVYAGTQRPAFIRKMIHAALDIPEHRIRAISPATGGGFGGKSDLSMHILVALLAIKTGKPVKLVWTREESFLMHPKRHPFWIRARLGARRDGTLTALEAEMLSDAGAYASHSLIVMFAACSYLPGPYDIQHLRLRGRSVYTNNPISGACRGYGQPQAVTPLECLIDWIAADLGIDPVEIRLKNALKLGDEPGSPRVVLDTPPTLPLTIQEALADAGDLPEPSGPRKKVGRGISCAMPIF
ncbi:MAG: xanthine dehydrogenase family protein molybdopterin-binding subunit, partial [Anaerolineales bacterium]